jgi:hypothetical protein
MALHPPPVPAAPEATARVAHAACPGDTWSLWMRAECGAIFAAAAGAARFPPRGPPAKAPWRLALVTSRHEGADGSARRAAAAVRRRRAVCPQRGAERGRGRPSQLQGVPRPVRGGGGSTALAGGAGAATDRRSPCPGRWPCRPPGGGGRGNAARAFIKRCRTRACAPLRPWWRPGIGTPRGGGRGDVRTAAPSCAASRFPSAWAPRQARGPRGLLRAHGLPGGLSGPRRACGASAPCRTASRVPGAPGVPARHGAGAL